MSKQDTTESGTDGSVAPAALASHDSAHPGLVLEISLLEDDFEPPQVRVLH